ncbi:diguanylate cyclase [Oxalobacteraceae bacterium OM1]|nr:diguanylate cyclase [Oxalobacteraceae bacterium OM1]
MDQPAYAALPPVLLHFIRHSENGVAVFDADDRFIFHNDAFARMFGFAGRSMVGRTHEDMLVLMAETGRGIRIDPPSPDAWLAQMRARHRASAVRNVEVDLVDGRWILLSEQVHASGELLMFCSDITRQKNAERALADAHAELERIAITDDLTGAFNRRHFSSQLDVEVARALRYGTPLCLALLDLDRFKDVNDRYGHAAGDTVLRHFAGMVRRELRSSDLFGRIGGEEFAVLMPQTGTQDAAHALRRIAAAVQNAALDDVAPGFRYTCSAGVALLPAEQAGSSELLARADYALYQAKEKGRNRVEIDGS